MATLKALTAGKSAAAERFMADFYKPNAISVHYKVLGQLLVQMGELVTPAHNDPDGYVKWCDNGDDTYTRILYVSGDWQQGGGWWHTDYNRKGEVIAIR